MSRSPGALFFLAAAIAGLTLATGCTETRRSTPERTATEQMLLSTAVDRAVGRLEIDVPKGTMTYLDVGNFDAYDEGYAIGTLRDILLRSGLRLTNDRSRADLIVEARAGALSINGERTLVGLPGFDIPVPLSSQLSVPEIALLSRDTRRGIAKIGLTAYWRESGALADREPPTIGVSGYDDWSVLGLGWRDGDDFVPPPPDDGIEDGRSPQ